MPDVLKGLYARRDAIRARIGERVMSLSRMGSALVAANDEFADEAILDLELTLQSVEAQISAYLRPAI
jgi:hypothetical protein